MDLADIKADFVFILFVGVHIFDHVIRYLDKQEMF